MRQVTLDGYRPRKNPQFVILSEAKSLSFLYFPVLAIEERFFASLRMTEEILPPQPVCEGERRETIRVRYVQNNKRVSRVRGSAPRNERVKPEQQKSQLMGWSAAGL